MLDITSVTLDLPARNWQKHYQIKQKNSMSGTIHKEYFNSSNRHTGSGLHRFQIPDFWKSKFRTIRIKEIGIPEFRKLKGEILEVEFLECRNFGTSEFSCSQSIQNSKIATFRNSEFRNSGIVAFEIKKFRNSDFQNCDIPDLLLSEFKNLDFPSFGTPEF